MRLPLFVLSLVLCAGTASAQTDATIAPMQAWFSCVSEYTYVALEGSPDPLDDIITAGFKMCTDTKDAYASALQLAHPDWTDEQQQHALVETQKQLNEKLFKAFSVPAE